MDLDTSVRHFAYFHIINYDSISFLPDERAKQHTSPFHPRQYITLDSWWLPSTVVVVVVVVVAAPAAFVHYPISKSYYPLCVCTHTFFHRSIKSNMRLLVSKFDCTIVLYFKWENQPKKKKKPMKISPLCSMVVLYETTFAITFLPL